MDRHTFLKNSIFLIAAGITLPKLPVHFFSNHGIRGREFNRLFIKLDSGFLLTKDAARLGEEYLSFKKNKEIGDMLHPETHSEKSKQEFVQLNRSLDYRKVQEMIQSDFDLNKTVRLKGWILSETEAELCAMYTMAT